MGLGATLKNAREEKNISLDELQESTKIQKRYLTAIEEENFKILPGTFYAKAFIKEYAVAVGLDPAELMEMYQTDGPETEEQQEQQYTRIQSRKESNSQKTNAIFSLIPMVIVVILIIGILFAGIYFYKQNNSKNDDGAETPKDDNEIIINGPDDQDEGSSKAEDDKDNQASDVDKNDTGDKADDEEKKAENKSELKLTEEGSGSRPESDFELENAGDELKVKLESDDNTWLQVSNGQGENKYYDSLTSDKSPVELDMSGDDEIYFSIGNAAALTITINGVKLDYPVDPKQYVVQKIRVHVKE